MAKNPIEIKKEDLNISDHKEDEYQKVHLFEAKAKADRDFSKPIKDKDGNWISEDNWVTYQKTMKKYS